MQKWVLTLKLIRLMSILPINNLENGIGGGKAQGLAFLNSCNMQIPLTYVVNELDLASINSFIESLPKGIKLAIRSSAEGEDGQSFSFAGQYISILDVDKENATAAITECFQAQEKENVSSYSENLHTNQKGKMNVIVQEMVQAVSSGVLFTADPVNNRHDKMSLSIVRGIGERLMSGQEEGEQFDFYSHTNELPNSKIISEQHFQQIVNQANKIVKQYKQAADLEWAIDKDGKLFWLQLRPITQLSQVHFNELDNNPLYENPIYTRGNIGEMMPGPVTPLTLSTFAVAIDVGLQVFYKKTGALKELSEDMLFVHSFYNHLFFDLNRLYEIAKKVILTTKENIDYTVVGKTVPNIEIKPDAYFIKRFINFISLVQYLNSAPKSWKKLKKMNQDFAINCPDNAIECYNLIDKNLPILNEAYSLHYVTSSQSGGLFSAILNTFSGGKTPSMEHQRLANSLFSNIPDVESAEVIKSLDHIALTISKIEAAPSIFISSSIEKSKEYLQSDGPEEVTEAWNEFIKRHGQRGVREAELFEKEWAVKPNQLIESIKAKVSLLISGESINGKKQLNNEDVLKDLSFSKKITIKNLIPKARKAVARREQTKAWSINIQSKFKIAYRHLADLLVKQELLLDKEYIFFLTHQEIGELVNQRNVEHWKKVSKERFDLYPKMKGLSFDDLSFGIPIPQDNNTTDNLFDKNGHLSGIPVSHGHTEAKVRIIESIEDAAKLKKGEIMVAKFTDVGWTPFYGIISGLITEIGSPLSHGAVVAREYGLPTVVSMKGATSHFVTGQTIQLDAVNGLAKVLIEK